MKTRDLLAWGSKRLGQAGLPEDEAQREALLALAHLVQKRPPEVYLLSQVPEEIATRFREIIENRAQGRPLAYLLGEVEFFGRPFWVSPAVLIPRPETEILVESVLEFLGGQTGLVLELGVGSGCVSLTLALEAPKIKILGIEKSAQALQMALKNRRRWGLEERVFFLQGDWLRPLKPKPAFIAIVSNPPYVSREEFLSLPLEVREHEPQEALLAEEEGLFFIRQTLEKAPCFLRPNGAVFLEIGYRQRERVEELAIKLGYRCLFKRDLLGYDRVLVAQLKDARGPSCE